MHSASICMPFPPAHLLAIQGTALLTISMQGVLSGMSFHDLDSSSLCLKAICLWRRCLTQMGTQKESFVELTERIGRKTGGLSVSPFVSDRRGSAEPLALIMISGKAMADKAGDLLELFRDVLLTARLDDRERFKQVPVLAPCALHMASAASQVQAWITVWALQKLQSSAVRCRYAADMLVMSICCKHHV